MKDSPWCIRWTVECGQAFQGLKDHLCWELVLFSPNFMHEFILQTDASEVGLGAILAEESEEEEHPILHIS